MYEVQWDTTYRIMDGGNPFEPCMALVREKARANESIPIEPFLVTPLHADNPEPMVIGLSTILGILNTLTEDEENEVFLKP